MDKTFLYGVISGTIGSVLAAWIVYLIARPMKTFWNWFCTPRPLSLTEKVKLTEQLEANRKSLERLNHLGTHPKDLYLYLFQLGITVSICMFGALFIYLLAPHDLIPLGVLLLSIGVLLSVLAIWEASRMSVKNIDRTRAALESTIYNAMQKLGLPTSNAKKNVGGGQVADPVED